MTYPPTPDEPETAPPMMDEEAPPSPLHQEATEGSAPETVNIMATVPADKLKKYGEDVFRKYERDLQSSAKFRERRANIVKLFLGQMPPKPEGMEMMAQVHYPIIAKALLRIHARVYDQQFPSNGEYFGVKPTDQNDLERSVRVAKHLNWQILHQVKEYVPNHDALIMQWLLYGSAFTVFYWDPVKNRPCHHVCRTDDIVLPYTASVGADVLNDPHLSEVPRITRVLRKYRHELEDIADTGYYDAAAVAKLFEEQDKEAESNADAQTPAPADDKSTDMQSVMDQAQGQEKPSNDEDSPRVLLEQHHWCKLPGEKRYKPVITTIDKETKAVLAIVLREDEDPVDRARFNREEAAANASYQAAMQQWQMDMAQYFGAQPPAMDMGAPTMPGAETMGQPPMPGQQDMTEPPMPGPTDMAGPPMMGPPPMEPQMPAPPAQPKMIPINFFTHYVCIPNPEGIYGWGVGYMLEGHNMVADTIASQIVYAGTLANTSTFLYSKHAKLKRGELKIKPGAGTEVDLLPQDMKNATYPITFAPPNPALAEFINDQKEEADELSGAGEILSGEVGGSNETATTTQIRVSQALAAIGIFNKRYTRSRTAEGENLARLNSVYLADDEYFHVVDPNKPDIVEEQKVARIDYLQDCDITVTADPRMASQPQRVSEAQTALQAVLAGPLSMNDPIMVGAAQRQLFVAMDMPKMVAGLDSMMQKMAQGLTPPGAAAPPGGAPPGGPKGPTGPAVPMPKRVPNAGPTPTNGVENGQVT